MVRTVEAHRDEGPEQRARHGPAQDAVRERAHRPALGRKVSLGEHREDVYEQERHLALGLLDVVCDHTTDGVRYCAPAWGLKHSF